MRHGESQGNQDMAAYTTTPDHNIQSTTQGMAKALHAGEHLRLLRIHYARTQLMLYEFRRCFLKKRLIGVREESRVRERNFGNFQVEERMKVIKEIRERFERFFY
ncbi:Phosphoglycerate mutase-like protein AT74H [Glycine soja]